ncbi:RdgB/HAM1 family non-canonical purine NTP pyrophosphatase [Pseudactinotalea suaedae]|uniref:RdgB/HAM1 family non-canonical purine NTP pyrophosphatase n=1 Tax=Pseudactinotalea suaedae TaxID=1524924 RepID=UPI0012E265B9|nr:RdgB/HAM1 family non-canonical purine NTP pyrophosphatase [Pseudactinotalea suaedae]
MTISPRLVLATRNDHKLQELRDILAAAGVPTDGVVSAADVDGPDVPETGVTFAENALLKARALVAHTGLPAVADDSGFAVDVLGGSPGVFSVYWAGRQRDDAANNALLLAQLEDVGPEHRGAQFVCAGALVTPDGREEVREGVVRGRLLTEPVGGGGFGYDPLFMPDGHDRSYAQLTSEEKNAISHRSRAFRELAPLIAELLA